MSDDRLERVRTRLNASPELEEAVRRAVAEGKVPEAAAAVIPSEAADAAGRDRERLERVVPSDALEAIVQRVGRPPLLVRNDTVELEPLVDFPPGTDTLIKKVEPDVRSVGRVEFLNHSMAWGGTGWVIDEDGTRRVVATNRHVAKLVARRTADGRGVFLRSPLSGARYGMNLDFKEEVESLPADARPVSITEILYLADDAAPDVALLRIAGENLPSVLPLADLEAGVGDLVALIGYPAFDSRNNVDDQARYFHDLYDVKRFAPGKVMQALSGRTVLSHDCTSLGGNSGSPLVDLQTGKVVGLHFAGAYGLANSAVGVRTLQGLLTGRTRRVIVGPISTGPDGQSEARTDGVHSTEELTGRRGYAPGFLGEGLLAPWPDLPAAVETDLARPTDAEPERLFELRYTHFGVRFSTSRRQPLMTAVNIDGRHSVRIKRGNDRWFADARIPLETQLGQADYDDPEIDRGHMVRREDPNWDPAGAPGAVSALAEQADQDTFHYTNAAPQHSTMNQGKQLWQGLENYILDSARTRGFKACVFTGQVVREDDPEIKPGVQTPREFWKLVAMIDADRDALHATAYLLSQGDLIRELLEKRERTEAVEGFILGAYRTFQIAIRDLADATGYDFSAYLAADPLDRTDSGREATGDAAPIFVPLESLADVVT
jgi:endonuclease G, mitochondrial